MPAAPVLAAALVSTSVVLAAPVSAVLATAEWTRRAPRAALVLWQAVCLAAGLCLIGGGFVLALQPLGHNMYSALRRWLERLWAGQALVGMTGHGIVLGTLATAAALLLFGVLIRTGLLTLRRRRAHRLVLDLLTGDRAGDPPRSDRGSSRARYSLADAVAQVDVADLLADIRILDHPTAVAYTLPGWHSRVVLSAGMFDLLGRSELIAVIDHEKAHVRSRHDLLVLPFQAWATLLGWLPGVRAASGSVAELTEMLADDWAAGRSTPATLARALATVALAGVPPDLAVAGSPTPAVAGRSVAARVERLLSPRPLGMFPLVCVYLAAALLLLLPAAALLNGWS